MATTTYVEEGLADARTVLRKLVRDLTGAGTPQVGTAAAHMRLIYPEGFDTSTDPTGATMVVLEATTAIDPFADDSGTGGAQYDPWRLVLHCEQWQKKAYWDVDNSAASLDPTQVYSLAMYVGTPSTIVIDPTTNKPVLGWLFGGKDSGTAPSYAGTLSGTGTNPTWAYLSGYTPRYLTEPIGNIGEQWTNTFDPTDNAKKYSDTVITGDSPPYQSPQLWEGPDITKDNQVFLNKYVTSGPSTTGWGGSGVGASTIFANVNSYRVVTTDHGVFIGIWGPDPEENGKGFNWLLIQRPVDKEDGIVRGVNKETGLPYAGELNPNTGLAYPIGNRPLFCVYCVGGKYGKYVVREHDNPVPSSRKDATKNTTDSGAVINPYQQQSLTENGEYVITFLNNLNSSRFRYSDELDMLGTVSSDVVGGGSSIDVSVYSETQKRTYHALWSSGSFGTKMRIMVVENIPAPRTPVPEEGGGEGGGA